MWKQYRVKGNNLNAECILVTRNIAWERICRQQISETEHSAYEGNDGIYSPGFFKMNSVIMRVVCASCLLNWRS